MSENEMYDELEGEIKGLADNLTDLAEVLMDMDDVRSLIGDRANSAYEVLRITNKWIETVIMTIKSPVAKFIAKSIIKKYLKKEKKK